MQPLLGTYKYEAFPKKGQSPFTTHPQAHPFPARHAKSDLWHSEIWRPSESQYYSLFLPGQQVPYRHPASRLVADHDAGGVGVSAHHNGHEPSVGDSQVGNSCTLCGQNACDGLFWSELGIYQPLGPAGPNQAHEKIGLAGSGSLWPIDDTGSCLHGVSSCPLAPCMTG